MSDGTLHLQTMTLERENAERQFRSFTRQIPHAVKRGDDQAEIDRLKRFKVHWKGVTGS